MKPIHLAITVALAVLLTTGCDRNSPELAKQFAELERKANEATARQKELEQQLEDQKIAAEREAIERERMRIEEARAELERQQGEAATAEAEKIRQHEEALAKREGKLEMWQSSLEEKQTDLQQRDQQLSERDLQLAGHEAVTDADDNNNAQSAPVGDYGMFYDSLSSFGSWFETPDYGYVWQPVIVRDLSWRPYTRGRWVCTNRGWTWISDEPFGWATYHYGRWALCSGYGWIWVPGSEWAPSWVSWRSSASHIGWAPLPPETLAYRGRRCDSTVDVTFGIGVLWFNFVEIRYFGNPIHHHCLPYTQNNIYIGQTLNITNIYVHNRRVICGGPRYGDVARQTDRKPPFYRIEEDRHGKPGRDSSAMRPMVQGDRLRVAAPNIDAAWNDGLKPEKIKGRIESIKVERQQEPLPEVADDFRQSREKSRRKADQSVAEQNRQREEIRPNQPQAASSDNGPRIHPPKPSNRQDQDDSASRLRKQREELAEQNRRREEIRPNQPQAPSSENGPRIHPPKDASRQVQDDSALRLRKQQEDQAERARQQQQADQREQARQQQMENLRREQQRAQQRQQQMEDARREQQRAQQRQQRMEDSRREQQRGQARQQQVQQARQKQPDQAQREQTHQQQQQPQKREDRSRKQAEDDAQTHGRNR